MSMECQALRCRLPYFMRPFLFVALVTGLLTPTAAMADSVWLIMREESISAASFLTIEVKNMDQCELEGAKFVSSERLGKGLRGFECLKGK